MKILALCLVLFAAAEWMGVQGQQEADCKKSADTYLTSDPAKKAQNAADDATRKTVCEQYAKSKKCYEALKTKEGDNLLTPSAVWFKLRFFEDSFTNISCSSPAPCTKGAEKCKKDLVDKLPLNCTLNPNSKIIKQSSEEYTKCIRDQSCNDTEKGFLKTHTEKQNYDVFCLKCGDATKLGECQTKEKKVQAPTEDTPKAKNETCSAYKEAEDCFKNAAKCGTTLTLDAMWEAGGRAKDACGLCDNDEARTVVQDRAKGIKEDPARDAAFCKEIKAKLMGSEKGEPKCSEDNAQKMIETLKAMAKELKGELKCGAVAHQVSLAAILASILFLVQKLY